MSLWVDKTAFSMNSTCSVNRHGRFRDSDILRKVFEEVVCGCMTAGLVGGEGFAVDASVIEANASRFQRVEGSEVDWTHEQRARRPVQEYLVALESENAPINPKQKPKPCRRGRALLPFKATHIFEDAAQCLL